jgi:hypothetical protein
MYTPFKKSKTVVSYIKIYRIPLRRMRVDLLLGEIIFRKII